MSVSALPGCSLLNRSPEAQWGVPTMYSFGGLTLDDTPAVERVFVEQGFSYRRVDDAPITYRVEGVATLDDLGRLQTALMDAARAGRIDLPFEDATLVYGGLKARGAVTTELDISVSAGAAAYIADGPSASPWRRVTPDARGHWKGAVSTQHNVLSQGGWLYIAAAREDFIRYSRVHVLSRKQEPMSFARFRDLGLPDPGTSTPATASSGTPNARRVDRGERTSTSSGWKWPWQR